MVKVVINSCYGGYGLSPKAFKRISELQGKECYFFVSEFENGKFVNKQVDMSEIHGVFFEAMSTPNLPIYDDWYVLTNEEKRKHNEAYLKAKISNFRDDRTNELLIRVVEELGTDKASGAHSSLKIVEIPDDVEWEIHSNDGLEWVAEKHQTWD